MFQNQGLEVGGSCVEKQSQSISSQAPIAGSITLMNLILSVAGPLESATWFRARLAHLLGAGPPSPLSLHPQPLDGAMAVHVNTMLEGGYTRMS